jgi:hypothetical protein
MRDAIPWQQPLAKGEFEVADRASGPYVASAAVSAPPDGADERAPPLYASAAVAQSGVRIRETGTRIRLAFAANCPDTARFRGLVNTLILRPN